jgi:hypothetical protein
MVCVRRKLKKKHKRVVEEDHHYPQSISRQNQQQIASSDSELEKNVLSPYSHRKRDVSGEYTALAVRYARRKEVCPQLKIESKERFFLREGVINGKRSTGSVISQHSSS